MICFLRASLTAALLAYGSLPTQAFDRGEHSAQSFGPVQAPAINLTGTDSTGIISGLCSKAAGASACRSMADRATDVIQAVDFGVTCDDATGTDQSAAIMAATNAAVALGGRDVVFPSSATCRIKSFMTPPSKTRWVSKGGTVFYLDPAMSVSASVGGAGRAILFNNVSDILIDGITFQGAGASSLPCPAPCNRILHIAFQNAKNVVIRNVTIQDFGYGTTLDIPAPGIIVFGGNDYLVDNTTIRRTSGDNLAFSNGAYNVEVRGSNFSGSTGDSALVCTIGGRNMRFHHNVVTGPAGNAAPIIVMDRCSNWDVSNNTVGGAEVGQAIRVARYGDTPETSHDFTITHNTITGADVGISVESAGAKQGSQTASGGGRFTIAGNTILGSTTAGIQIVESEVGAVTGNVVVGAPTGIFLTGYTPGTQTGYLAISGNTINGATYGVREVNSGGRNVPSAYSGNLMIGVAMPYTLATETVAPSIPFRTPPNATARPCNPGQTLMDATYFYGCTAAGTFKRIPWQRF